MSKSYELKSFLDKAKEQEKKYNWPAAAEFYEKALGLALKVRDFSEVGEIGERIGYCFYRAAFQAETNEDFRRRMRLAAEAYDLAAEQFGKVEKRVRGDCCRAFGVWVNYWIAPNYAEKKVLLAECRGLWKKVAIAYKEAGDQFGYGEACNKLLECLWHSLWIVPEDWSEAKEIYEEGIRFGESAISTLSEAGDEHELARAYCLTSRIHFWGHTIVGKEEGRREFLKKMPTYAQRAVELSKKLKDAYLIALSSWPAAWSQVALANNLELGRKHCEEMLKQSKKTKDNSLIGEACLTQAWQIGWATAIEEDPDKLKGMFEEINAFADEAIAHLSLISWEEMIALTYSFHAYEALATRVETDYDTKHVLLEKAIEAGRKGLVHAERAGAVWPSIIYSLSSLSNAKRLLSSIETNLETKKKLLKEALKFGERSKFMLERLAPFNYVDRGGGEDLLARTKTELAKIETDIKAKRELLEEAVSNMEERLKLFQMYKEQWTLRPEQTKYQSAAFGFFFGRLGSILTELYSVTNDKKVLERIARVYENAVESYRKADLQSRVAEAHWQIAKGKDKLGEHLKAAENFESASRRYKASAEKMPQLKEFYTDYALYMRAWSEIEKARHNHEKEDYNQSKEHYEKAASNLKSSRKHSYLSPYFAAWAMLEHAEDPSRKEKARQSITAFQQASETFGKAKESIETEVNKIASLDEREKATELVEACRARIDYCQGRIHLEEAKIHDREGDHLSSAKKYGSASKVFQRVMKAVKSELEHRDLLQTAYLCQAWQKMMMAEAKVSPELYLEAATLFEKAKEHSVKERTSLLSLGNSYFCKALEAGTIFEATRDMNLYSMAKRHLESAATYYTKAGFEKASTWVNATEALFDAYVYMSNAEVEVSHKKKTKLYGLAERHLERSAQLYEKAGYIGKRDEVLRSLKKVKEKWEFTLSLDEVLAAPSITSSTTLISSPTTQEEAVGVERFEHADIQANLIIHVKEVKVGEDLSLEIELVNAGKGPALLIKVEEIIPEGFKLKDKPEMYRVEDRYLNMKGKRLDPLKTEEVRLVLNPIAKGTFPLKPRILYLDETGKYKSHEPEPVTVTVKELGISGWLKGPSR